MKLTNPKKDELRDIIIENEDKFNTEFTLSYLYDRDCITNVEFNDKNAIVELFDYYKANPYIEVRIPIDKVIDWCNLYTSKTI